MLGHVCPVCGTVYDAADRAARCASVPPAPEEVPAGTLVEARGAARATGPGLVRGSFLLGLEDPRGATHARLYRTSFIWGRADLGVDEIDVKRPATEAEWREAVETFDPTDSSHESHE